MMAHRCACLENVADTPLHSAEDPGQGYRCRGCRLFDEWVLAQNGVTAALVRVAEVCQIDRSGVHKWRSSRRAPVAQRGPVESATGVGATEWDMWERDGEPLPDPEAAEQERGRGLQLAPRRELLGIEAELHRSVQLSNQILEGGLGGGLSATQIAALQRVGFSALKILAQLEARRSLAEHPDFGGLVEDLVAALLEELGPTAPPGIEARIADRFEVKQSARTEAKQRRAA